MRIKRHFLVMPKGKDNWVRPPGTGLRNTSIFNPPGKQPPNNGVFKELVLLDLQKVFFKNNKQQSIDNEGIK